MNAPVSFQSVNDGSAAVEQTLALQRAAFAREPMPSFAVRADRLDRLQRLIEIEGEGLLAAIDRDFDGRSVTESQLIELFPSLESVRYARRNLRRWMRPERRRVSIWLRPARAEVVYQPRGVVGIVVPWNYPLFLGAGPLAGALAAGNRVMLKMSELTPNFSLCFAHCVAKHFSPEEVSVVLGDADAARHFVSLPFDHLLFTGSTAVGRHVMRAAADHLTPVTLELGGKSPAIVADDFDLATAAQRIVFCKLLNAGQTCVAPDYVLVPESRCDAFVSAARHAAKKLHPDGARPDYGSIVSVSHHARLVAMLNEAVASGATAWPLFDDAVLTGRRLAPVALTGVTGDMRLMQEEIFGPLLPVVTYRHLDEAIAFVNGRARPLALYVFSNQERLVDRVLSSTHSGGAAVNDCMLQIAVDDLPFGGIGPSGIGAYRGPEGFRTFSHARSVLRQARFNPLPLLHPPYGMLARRLLRLMLWRWRTVRAGS